MNFCIAGYLRIKSWPNNAIWFIKTNFLEAIKYFRLSIGAIVLLTLTGSQSPTNFYTGNLCPEAQPLTLLYTLFLEKGNPFI